jgi:hypothetical protein
VGDRQKTCGSSACKKEWHRKKCAEWNKKNKECAKGNGLNKKLKSIPSEESPSADRPCSESKSKSSASINVSLKSGLNPKDFDKIFTVEQAIVIEYITDQIIRQALSGIKRPEE